MTVREVVDVLDLEIQGHQASINRLKRRKATLIEAAQARVKTLPFPSGEEKACPATTRTKKVA